MTVLGITERWRGAEVHLKIYARILICLLVVSFYLSWRDVKIQTENNGSSSAPIKFDTADYEVRQQLTQTERDLANANEAIKSGEIELKATKEQLAEARRQANEAHNTLTRLAKIADAEKEYHGVALLNLIGKPGPDGDIIYNTPISKSLEGAYVLQNDVYTYKKDQTAEHRFRDTITLDGRFPFSYIGLAIILKERNDRDWKEYMTKGRNILDKATLIPGHHPDHDHVLKIAEAALDESKPPSSSVP